MNLNIITTSRRKVIYIHEMMDSLFASDFIGKINILAGDDNTGYLDKYKDNPNITIVPWNLAHDKPRHDCRRNHIRALKYGGAAVVICEDDVIFEKNWMENLVKSIKRVKSSDYVLDIGKPVNPGSESDPVPIILQGIWGLYYSSQYIKMKIIDCLEDSLKVSGKCTDNTIARFCISNSYLWKAQVNMLRHIGQESTFNTPLI